MYFGAGAEWRLVKAFGVGAEAGVLGFWNCGSAWRRYLR